MCRTENVVMLLLENEKEWIVVTSTIFTPYPLFFSLSFFFTVHSLVIPIVLHCSSTCYPNCSCSSLIHFTFLSSMFFTVHPLAIPIVLVLHCSSTCHPCSPLFIHLCRPVLVDVSETVPWTALSS